MFRNSPDIYEIVVCEMEKETGQPPPYAQVDTLVRFLRNMPSDELREIIEGERKHLQQN